MATKKDLVEAYSFSRRRLVTAFVSGAPGGREVEPARPGRSIIGGVALAVLMVAIGAVIGFIRNPSSPEWGTSGLITEKESGAAYLNMPPPAGSDDDRFQLRPLQNITSALLIFDGKAEAQRVSHDLISERPRGPGIGILGAPATPPEAGKLVQTGWTACSSDASLGSDTPREAAGTSLVISTSTDVEPDAGLRFVVRAPGGGVWLIAEAPTRDFAPGQRAYRYRMPQSGASAGILSAVAGSSEPVDVSDEWLALFPQGADLALTELDLGPVGTPWTGKGFAQPPPGARVGGLLRVGPDENYVLTADGAIKLDAFSLELYERLIGEAYPPPIDVDRGPGDFTEISALPLRWPSTAEPATPSVQGRLCAVLDARAESPGVRLATRPVPSTEDPVPNGETSVVVDSGAGAFVYSGDWQPGPVTPVLVDDQGTRFPVAEQADEPRLLGYGDVDRVVAPDSWLDLLQGGVELSRAAALCPPSPEPGAGGCAG